ncbi:MAG: universal stress protein [Nitrospirae bacterium]|jgi:nucleotide-binding universal stress UspA family protein|nr:universal stress protein [Nitrospirota bacterium]
MYKKILYPIKFEEFSLDVLSCLLNFKKAGAEEVILLHILDVSKLPMDKYQGYSPEDVKRLTEIVNAKMDEAVRMIEDKGLIATRRIGLGVPYREIIRIAGEEKVSLIVSGRQKRGILGEIFIGSNTDKVIRYGKFPVYIPKYPAVCGGDKEECERYCERLFSRILYPTDWSDCAKEALLHLKGLKDAGVEEVIIAHVMNEKAMKLQPPDIFRAFEREDKKKLEEVKHELEEEGLKVKTSLSVGNARADLIKIAKEENISLIVMGAHGKGYIEGILWGSVSRNVVEYSDRSVLLIKGGRC